MAIGALPVATSAQRRSLNEQSIITVPAQAIAQVRPVAQC
jgi:hypothetical protein